MVALNTLRTSQQVFFFIIIFEFDATFDIKNATDIYNFPNSFTLAHCNLCYHPVYVPGV